MKNSIRSTTKLERGKGKRTNFHTKDDKEELEETLRDWKMHVHRDKEQEERLILMDAQEFLLEALPA